jgi:hypothetical protein
MERTKGTEEEENIREELVNEVREKNEWLKMQILTE